MSKLIIRRNSEWNNKGRSFWIYIDGEKVEKIADGQTRLFDLEPGKYEVYAKVDWCSSEKMDIEVLENQNTAIGLSGFKYGNIVLASIFGTVLIYLLISLFLKMDFNFLLIFAVIAFLYPVYYITLGKNKYISIAEISAEPPKELLLQNAF